MLEVRGPFCEESRQPYRCLERRRRSLGKLPLVGDHRERIPSKRFSLLSLPRGSRVLTNWAVARGGNNKCATATLYRIFGRMQTGFGSGPCGLAYMEKKRPRGAAPERSCRVSWGRLNPRWEFRDSALIQSPHPTRRPSRPPEIKSGLLRIDRHQVPAGPLQRVAAAGRPQFCEVDAARIYRRRLRDGG